MNINYKLQFKNLFVLGVFLVLLSCSKDEKQTVTTMNQLVWHDEFDTTGAPNSNLWTCEIGLGPDPANTWGNHELQCYTNRPDNVLVKDGMLQITAIEEAAQIQGKDYTSARINTKVNFERKYGRIEARIKLPWGKGLLPAFWLLGSKFENTKEDPDDPKTLKWPNCGEIDIMEYLGNKPTSVFGTVHGPGYAGSQAITKTYTLPNGRFDTDFHVFGIEWGENYINYYVDDVLYNQITPTSVTGEWVFNQEFYIILNLAVGGNLPGSPNNETSFPQTMLVDYVRVYQ